MYLWQSSNGTAEQLGAFLLDNQLVNAFRRNPCPPVKGFIGKLEKFFVAFIRLQQVTVSAFHLPKLNKELEKKLGDGEWVAVDSEDEMVVNFYYPQIFESEYLRSCVRLEIGPLAEWMPSHETVVSPFAAEKYPDVFTQKETSVLTIDVERTFWEKLTILHKIANFPEGKVLPARYARHLYDVYNLGNSWVKESAFARKELLEKDVAFKQKFYYAKSAHYETATLNSIELMPSDGVLDALKADYNAMRNMIYGEIPEFEEILNYLNALQEEVHKLTVN